MSKRQFDYVYKNMNADIRKLCDDILDITGDRYAVESSIICGLKSHPFSMGKTEVSYTVLAEISGSDEVQCINLITGLGGGYPKNEAMAFLLGVRAGALRNKKS
jgi:hypothetical protein